MSVFTGPVQPGGDFYDYEDVSVSSDHGPVKKEEGFPIEQVQ